MAQQTRCFKMNVKIKLPHACSACNLITRDYCMLVYMQLSSLNIIKMCLLMLWQETGIILHPKVDFWDTEKKSEKPGQSRFLGTSGHPMLVHINLSSSIFNQDQHNCLFILGKLRLNNFLTKLSLSSVESSDLITWNLKQ